MLVGNYNVLLVLFSIFVAVLSSYTALDLVGRISSAKGRAASFWAAGGACAMGLGVWSMHFIGMLAFSLPIPMGYDLPLTVASLLIAIVSSWIALKISSRPNLPWQRWLGGAVLMGGGISTMHYMGMQAMQMFPAIDYRWDIVALSVVIAVLASGAALRIAFYLQGHSRNVRQQRLLASLVMGAAIVTMHYTGMHAARFPLGSVCGAVLDGLSSSALAMPIIVVTIAVLTVALVTSILDMRLELNTAMLSSSLAEANQELSHLALHDNLTKLPNRLLMTDRLKQAVEQARATKTSFAVMFLDLDGFKTINDTFGHQIGDQLLIHVANRLRQNIQAQDTSARLGGDEFVVLAPISVPADAATIAERICGVIDEPFRINEQDLSVSASIGIAVYPGNGEEADELLKNADIAMYHAKSLGRNQACFFDASMHTGTSEHMVLLQDLRLACKRGQLQLHYQPKFRAPAGPVIGVEALIRWNHPTRGMIAPNEFIPLAERTGLIVQIGEWVVDEACRQIAIWRKGGETNLTMSVNVSALQFNHGRFVEMIREALARHQLGPNALTLEVTESTAMRDVDASMIILTQLRDMGVQISIDDFGTGYSSLLYLKRMPATELKIDRGFITGLVDSSEDAAIVSAIVALGDTLKMSIVAEGVETDAQQAMLTRLGCDQLQGFLLGRPMAADAMSLLFAAPEQIVVANPADTVIAPLAVPAAPPVPAVSLHRVPPDVASLLT